ncbi:MAG TPA: hypothetical protein VGQ00_03815, partial [Candidatus Norongarragalinales archaeon]|nr:hypothetical protein [Candidatus Norongarragalinales archaeon]
MKLHCFLLLLFLPAFAHASDFFAYASRLGPQAFDWLTIADCTPFMNAQLSPANFRAYGSDFLVVQELADASKREIDGARNYAYLYRLAIPLQPGFSQLALGIACNAAARKSHALAARGAGIVLLALDAQSQKLSQLATVDYEGSAGGALKEIDEEKETLAGANGSKNNLASLLVSFKPKNAVDASKALLEDQRIADSSAQLFIRVSRALNDLQNEHDAALLALSEEESLAKNAVARLKELELERIPPGVFASGGSFNSFDAVRLDRSHRDAIIDFERCGTLRKQSVVIEKSASEGWLSRSTQKLRAAREECGKAAQLVADAESESIKLEDDLRTRVNTALASVRGALKKVESSNALEAARIGELLNKEEYWNEPGALGARVAMLAVKEQRLKDLQKQALSAQSSAGAVWNAKKEVDELADLAAKAGKDGINAKTQAQLARDLQGALSTGMDSSAASRLSIEASDARQELLDKSQEKFTTLQEEWSELYDLYAFDPAVREVVDKYAEKFGPGARVENALGSLSDAERELGKALRDHEANSENWLKELLQHSLRASKIVDEGLV